MLTRPAATAKEKLNIFNCESEIATKVAASRWAIGLPEMPEGGKAPGGRAAPAYATVTQSVTGSVI